MRRAIRIYLTTALVMVALDAVWLTLAADALYRPRIGHLMREQFLLAPAIAFYLLYLLGVLVLAQWPAADRRDAAWRGLVFGLCAYATYDLTNQATLQGWPWVVTAVDLVWGSVLTATVSFAGYVPRSPASEARAAAP